MSTPRRRRIESETNALFRNLKKLTSARGSRKSQGALVAGVRVVSDVVASRPAMCRAWISTKDQPGPPPEFPPPAEWYELPPRLFRALDMFGTGTPLLLVETPELTAWNPADGLGPGCTLMVPFQDPENVGAVIRSAVAFGVGDIVLLRECGHPFHPRAIRASGGAVFQATLRTGPSIAALPVDLPLVALSAGGRSIMSLEFPDRFAVVPGIEGPGLPASLRARAYAIPMSSRIESLNAATATAIALFVWAGGRPQPE